MSAILKQYLDSYFSKVVTSFHFLEIKRILMAFCLTIGARFDTLTLECSLLYFVSMEGFQPGGRGGGVLPHVGYIGMCRCEGHGFQAVYSRIGYINQSVLV